MSLLKVSRSKILFLMLLIAFAAQQFSIPLDITPIRPYMVLVIFYALFVFVSVVQRGSFSLNINPIDFSLLLLYSYIFCTIVYADDTAIALHLMGGLCVLIISYFIVKIYSLSLSLADFRQVLVVAAKIFFIGSFAWYLIGCIAYYFFNVSLDLVSDEAAFSSLYGVYVEGGIMPRFRGICDSPNNFGMYSVIFFPILFFYEEKPPIYLYIIFVFSVIATISTTTYFAFMLIFFIMSVISISKFNFKKISARFFKVSMCLFFIVLIICYFVINLSLVDSLNGIIDSRVARTETGSGRWELWEYTLELIKERPIFGYGLNQSRDLLLPLRALKSTHNNFLELLIEGGAVALFLYISLLITSIYCVFRSTKRGSDRNWMFYALIGTFVFSNANVNVYNDSFILLLALISVVYGYFKRKII